LQVVVYYCLNFSQTFLILIKHFYFLAVLYYAAIFSIFYSLISLFLKLLLSRALLFSYQRTISQTFSLSHSFLISTDYLSNVCFLAHFLYYSTICSFVKGANIRFGIDNPKSYVFCKRLIHSATLAIFDLAIIAQKFCIFQGIESIVLCIIIIDSW